MCFIAHVTSLVVIIGYPNIDHVDAENECVKHILFLLEKSYLNLIPYSTIFILILCYVTTVCNNDVEYKLLAWKHKD